MIKTISLSLSIFFTIVISLSSGCGPGNDPNSPGYPPNQVIIDPPVVFDNAGNIVTAYQINTGDGPSTYIQKMGSDGTRIWREVLDSRLPEPQTLKDKRPSFTELVSDGQGNTIITWNYQNQIFSKKLDENGQPVWDGENIKVGDCYSARKTLKSDQNFTIVWIDPNSYLNIQIIDRNGTSLIQDSKFIENVMGFDAVCDARGNTYIIFGQSFDETIQLLKVNALGQNEWLVRLQPGLITPANSVSRWKYEYWITDVYSDNVIVGWANNWERNAVNFQRIDSEGKKEWNITESFFEGDNRLGLTTRVVADGEGGMFALWDFFDSTNSQISLFLQHIDFHGKTSWDENGLQVCSNINKGGAGTFDYNINTDKSGGAIIVWESYNRNWYFSSQRVDITGKKLWGENGIVISDYYDAYMNHKINIDSDGLGSFFVSYGLLNADSFLQKINKDGTLPWGLRGIQLGIQ